MTNITGTKGNAVSVQMLGVGEVMRRLRNSNIQIKNGADLGVVKAGAYVEEEVKESIAGNRAEHKSVDSGQFINDTKFNKTGYAAGKVHSPNTPYAGYVEHSDRIVGGPRHHFRNTEKRTSGDVKKIIEKEIKSII